MALTNTQDTFSIPHEPGCSMTLRQFGWKQLAEAREVRSRTVVQNMRNMGGELIRELQGVQRSQDGGTTASQPTDPLNDYDQATLLYRGIVAWSGPLYMVPVDSNQPDGPTRLAPVKPETIDGLDPTTADWAARKLLEMVKPPTETEREERFFASTNGSGASEA